VDVRGSTAGAAGLFACSTPSTPQDPTGLAVASAALGGLLVAEAVLVRWRRCCSSAWRR
jgi:hypothetical protein